MEVRALQWNRIVHAPAKLSTNLFQLRLPLFTDRFTQYRKFSLPGRAAYMREAQKVKCLRFALSPFKPTLGRKTTKFNESGFLRMQLQTEPHQALAQFIEKPLGFRSIPESDDEVSSPGESHPQALSEPDVNLSAHPAPIIQPSAQSPSASGRKAEARVARLCPASIQPSSDGD
jgi:hypothetical protein